MNNVTLFESTIKKIVKNDIQTEAILKAYKVCFTPMMEATNKQKMPDMVDIKDLVFDLLSTGDTLNTYHWNTDKNSRHVLLNEIYDYCRDTADKLAEAIKALTNCKQLYPNDKILINISDSNITEDDLVAQVKTILNEYSKKIDFILTNNKTLDEGVKNILAGFCETWNVYIYKWNQFNA